MTPNELKWHNRYLDIAKNVSTWSKDPSTQIGAIAVDPVKRTILTTGFNGFPRGIEDSIDRLLDRETKYKYIVHAEMNAIYNATYSGVSLDGSYFYVYGLPICSECAKGIIQVGVNSVFIKKLDTWNPKWTDSWNLTRQMFKETGINVHLI